MTNKESAIDELASQLVRALGLSPRDTREITVELFDLPPTKTKVRLVHTYDISDPVGCWEVLT